MRKAIGIMGATLVVASALLTSSGARADGPAEGDALIAKGIELREKGKDEEALGLFRQALAKSPSARARAQVALAEQALGLWVAAEGDLTAALAAESDAWIAKNRAALEGALGVIRKHVTTLEVRGAEHADVHIDGVKIGSGAGPYRVEAGRRSLEVRAPGFQTTTRSVDLPPGGIARETITLVAAPNEPQATAGTPAHSAAANDKVSTAPASDGQTQRLLGWASVGTGVVLAAAGGVGLVIRKGIIDDYNDSCPGVGAQQQSATCNDKVSSSHSWQTIAIIAFIGGGVFAAGGGVLVATAPSSEPSKTSTAARIRCLPGIDGRSAPTFECAGTF